MYSIANKIVSDADAMQLALAQAALAAAAGEVPVGAIVVKDGVVIGSGYNTSIQDHDPTAHAEVSALRAAAKKLGNYRLDGCDLFVTLEPCAMCSGAMLHARLARVVFGAADAKTGVAGSVVNLFSNTQLNHQTQVQGGLLAEDCATLLQDFFKEKRKNSRLSSTPVREDALRTPDARFSGLSDYPWSTHYVTDLPALAGLRMHYLDAGPKNSRCVYLCLHGPRTWSYQFRSVIAEFENDSYRVIAPDLIGFGKSDKPKREAAHTLAWHVQVLIELVDRLDLRQIVLVLDSSSKNLGLALQNSSPERYQGLQVVESVTRLEISLPAYDAPFPDRGHRAALRAFAAFGAAPDIPK